MNHNIRKDIRKAMIDHEMTRAALARTTKLSPGHVSDLLGGRRGDLGDGWCKVLDALGLELCVRPKAQDGS